MNETENTTDAPEIDAATVLKIAEHYCHAKRKHPHFADRLCLDEKEPGCAKGCLETLRFILQVERRHGQVHAETLAECETAEAWEAYARGDSAAAVEECYDVIAVMLRVIDVLEGRQSLGRPE